MLIESYSHYVTNKVEQCAVLQNVQMVQSLQTVLRQRVGEITGPELDGQRVLLSAPHKSELFLVLLPVRDGKGCISEITDWVP